MGVCDIRWIKPNDKDIFVVFCEEGHSLSLRLYGLPLLPPFKPHCESFINQIWNGKSSAKPISFIMRFFSPRFVQSFHRLVYLLAWLCAAFWVGETEIRGENICVAAPQWSCSLCVYEILTLWWRIPRIAHRRYLHQSIFRDQMQGVFHLLGC